MKMKTALALALCCVTATIAKAQLLGVNPTYPQINFVQTTPGSLAYDPGTEVFSINTVPTGLVPSLLTSGIPLNNGSMQLQFLVDSNGNLISGTNGFILTGDVTEVVNGTTNEYSGTLLQGNVLAFGYLAPGDGGGVAQFDFRIALTGGELASQFTCGDDLAITMSSDASTFTGSFTNAFSGASKGFLGTEDTTPPDVTCPPLTEVVTTAATNSDDIPGFIITYPTPVVTDNCDPNPTIFEDTPSGSFVQLNAGDSLTVNVFGIDASGNFNSCSFTVIMGATNSMSGGGGMSGCSLGFTDTGCEPVTLPTDTNMCVATYTFPLPTATNCMDQTFVATASALSESGNVITLTNLGNGMMQGEFPPTATTNGDIITFTASDGNGNQVMRQCQVFVQDLQPPTILCQNQTATFKPIVTNAFSCSSANFNNTCIASSNFLWFSSLLQCPNFPRNCRSFTVHVFGQTIELSLDNTNITLNVPDAFITFSNGVPASTTIFTNGEWVTTAALGSGNTFISGLSWQVPFNLNNLFGNCWGRDQRGPFRCHVNFASWCGQFAVDTPGVVLFWQWSAVVESKLNTNCASLCVKPVDDSFTSCWRNSHPAGTCENFKNCLISGATGRGYYTIGRQQQLDRTGILSPIERCNLGMGTICEGAVDFKTPVAFDNCGAAVQVTCTPPSGSVFGPGNYTIISTAVDASGNTNECSFTLTVVAPLQVVFDCPYDDNIADNFALPDAGFNDMNCPDQPSTTEYVNCFHPGDFVCHKVRLLDCDGNDVTASMAGCVTVHLDVTERCGSYTNAVLVSDMTTNSFGSASSPGCLMVPYGGEFIYNLNTTGYPGNTLNSSIFFRSAPGWNTILHPACPLAWKTPCCRAIDSAESQIPWPMPSHVRNRFGVAAMALLVLGAICAIRFGHKTTVVENAGAPAKPPATSPPALPSSQILRITFYGIKPRISLTPDQVLATVNGSVIRLADILPLATNSQQITLDKMTLNYYLKRAVDRDLILQKAQQQGIVLDESQHEQLGAYQAMRDQPEPGGIARFDDLPAANQLETQDSTAFMLQTTLMTAQSASPNVTEDQVTAYYNQHETEFGGMSLESLQQDPQSWQQVGTLKFGTC